MLKKKFNKKGLTQSFLGKTLTSRKPFSMLLLRVFKYTTVNR